MIDPRVVKLSIRITALRAFVLAAIVMISARLLPPSDFGFYGAGIAMLSLMTFIAQFGTKQALVRLPGLDEDDLASAAVLVPALHILVGMGTFIVLHFIDHHVATMVAHVMIGCLIINGTSVVIDAYLERRLHLPQVLGIELAAMAVGNGVVAIVLAMNGFGLWSLLAGQVVYCLLRVAGAWILFLSRGYLRDMGRPRAGKALALLRVATPAAGVNAMEGLNQVMDGLILPAMIGATAYGLFERVKRICTAPAAFLDHVIDKAFYPVIARNQDRQGTIRRVFIRGTAIVVASGLPVVAVLAIYNEPIVRFLLGQQWVPVAHILPLLAAVLPAKIVWKMSHGVLNALGHAPLMVPMAAVMLGLLAGGLVLAAPYGLQAIAMVFAGVAVLRAVAFWGAALYKVGHDDTHLATGRP